MAEQNTAPNYENLTSYEATSFQPGDGIDLHTTSEGISTYAQGHALAQAAALDQRLGAAQGERREKQSISPEVAHLQQATKLVVYYRQSELTLAA